MTPRIAVLDDYQNIARLFADWGRLEGRATVTMFADHLTEEDALVERLAPFDAVGLMRERTPFPRRLIERLPNLRLIATSGMWNAAIDLVAAEERGIVVSGTQAGGGGTAQVTWMLILALARGLTTADRDVREGRWQVGLGEDVAGKTLGLLGARPRRCQGSAGRAGVRHERHRLECEPDRRARPGGLRGPRGARRTVRARGLRQRASRAEPANAWPHRRARIWG